MSISVSLGSFKNPQDKRRKEKEYQEYLKYQTKVNQQSEVSNDLYSKNLRQGIQPAVVPYKSTEEELQDISAQRELAVSHLREIMKRNSLDALQYLNTLDELNLFNRNWNDFKTQIKGQQFITPTIFGELWQRYKDLLASTGASKTGITIPLTQTDLDLRLRQLGRQINQSARERGKYTAKQLSDLEQRVKQAIADGNVDLLNKMLEDPESLALLFKEPPTTEAPKPSLVELPKLTQEEIDTFKSFNGQYKGKNDWLKATINASFEREGKKEYLTPSLVKQNKSENIAQLIQKMIQAQGEEAKEGEEVKVGTGTRKKKMKPPHKISGKGVEAKNIKPRYVVFGKYLIHYNNLRKSVLTVKYKSGAGEIVPSQHISEKFRDFMIDLLDNGRMSPTLYSELPSFERNIFDKLCIKAGVDRDLGIRGGYIGDDVKRFEILRGELIAGNDAPQVREELKRYVLRFLNDGTIPKKQCSQILYELACLA